MLLSESKLPSDTPTLSGAKTGAVTLLGKNTGAVKKHTDNKFQVRALIFFLGFLAVPFVWFYLMNDATKPKPRATYPSAVDGRSASATPVIYAAGDSLAPRSAGQTVTQAAAPVVVTVLALAPVAPTAVPPTVEPTLTPTRTATFTATPFPASFWVSVDPIWPDSSSRWCGGRYVNGQCLASVASGADWRLLSGRGAACPPSMALGSEIITESGAVYLCIDRARRVCADQVCPIYLYVKQSDPKLARFERAYSRLVGK